VIPARGGSKGLPRKNVRPLGGIPLIAHTIREALKSKLASRVVVSTDDAEIRRISLRHGAEVPFKRPPKYATDTASTYDVVRHATGEIEKDGSIVDVVVILQPTSPLRNSKDIDAAIGLLLCEKADSVISVSPARIPPAWYVLVDKAGRIVSLPEETVANPRQKALRGFHVFNGAIYVMRRDRLMRGETALSGKKILAHVMSPEESVDIDDAFDMEFAEFLLKRRGKGK
jgi:CMP-N,N'-diacetyllegionaminic acid synthase